MLDGDRCSAPAAPRTSLALFPNYSKLAWLCTHGGVIPKRENSPDLVAFSFVKSWQPCFHCSWVPTQKELITKPPIGVDPCVKHWQAEKCSVRSVWERKESKMKVKNQINPRKDYYFFWGAKDACFECLWRVIRWSIFIMCPFSLDFWKMLSL